MKFRLQLNFVEAKVVYVPRSCNKLAHVLAAFGVDGRFGDHMVWTTNFPTDVTSLVTSDRAVS